MENEAILVSHVRLSGFVESVQFRIPGKTTQLEGRRMGVKAADIHV